MTNHIVQKVFRPRRASQEVWNKIVEGWDGEGRYISWFVADVEDGDKMDVASQWMIDDGAKGGEFVILDMD